MTPYSPESEAYRGGLVERYVLYGDGRFGLQTLSASGGFHESPGTYSFNDSMKLVFWFDDNWDEWWAEGTWNGDCIAVKYNWVMGFDGFEDADYCESQGT